MSRGRERRGVFVFLVEHQNKWLRSFVSYHGVEYGGLVEFSEL